MAYFEARFPQHCNPIRNPKPEDYLWASRWYLLQDNLELSEKFHCTYRRLRWARDMATRRTEMERVG